MFIEIADMTVHKGQLRGELFDTNTSGNVSNEFQYIFHVTDQCFFFLREGVSKILMIKYIEKSFQTTVLELWNKIHVSKT